jgi:hypothetical protein
MDEDDQEHFQRELSDRRHANRGSIIRLAAHFECTERTCPVTAVRLMIVEELGRTKPMQKPV